MFREKNLSVSNKPYRQVGFCSKAFFGSLMSRFQAWFQKFYMWLLNTDL